jgi:hypothetical protein
VVFTLFGVAPLFFTIWYFWVVVNEDPVVPTMVWFGLVLPLVILLPIQQRGAMTQQAADSLWTAVWVIFGIFFFGPLCLRVCVVCSRAVRAPRKPPSPPLPLQQEAAPAQPVNVVTSQEVEERVKRTDDALAYL